MTQEDKPQKARTLHFKAATQPYQNLVDTYKSNCVSDIKMLCQAAMISRKIGHDVHSEFAACLQKVREINATRLPQTPIIDKTIIAQLCCHGHLEEFYKEFEKIKDIDPIDHNITDGDERVKRMILLDTRPAVNSFLQWLNEEEQWKQDTSDKRPVISWIYEAGSKDKILKLLDSGGSSAFEWPSGVELHNRINEALASLGLGKNPDMNGGMNNNEIRKSVKADGIKPNLKIVKS